MRLFMNIQRVYNELANTFDKVRERDKIIDQRDVATIIDMIHNDECKYCSMQRICWESKFNYTYNLIYEMIEKIEDVSATRKGKYKVVLKLWQTKKRN